MSVNAPGPQSGVPAGTDQITYATLRTRPTITIPLPQVVASIQLVGRPCILVGFSIREDAGAVAKGELVGGTDDNAQTIASLTFAANGSAIAEPGAEGPYCAAGLRFRRESGTFKGAVWVKV